MMICRTYKAFYSFELFGLLAQIALIVLDIRSRRAETKLGRYNLMGLAGTKGGDVKLDDMRGRAADATPGMHGHAHSEDSIPYGIGEYSNSTARSRDNAADYGHAAPSVRVQDFRND